MSNWPDYNGWLGVISPAAASYGATLYARQQAALLQCPLYTSADVCLPDTLIAIYDQNTNAHDCGMLLEHAKLRRATVILDVHNYYKVEMFSGVINNVICHCQSNYDLLTKHFDKVVLLPIPNLAKVANQANNKSLAIIPPATHYKIGWFGSWRPHKGIKRLLYALKSVRHDGIDVGLIAVGAGLVPDYVAGVSDYARTLKISQYFVMDTSFRSYCDISAILATCDMFCLPSNKAVDLQEHSSACPMLLSLGKPVLVSSDGSFDDVRSYCLTITDGSANQFAKWIRGLLIDTTLYRDYAARASAYADVCSLAIYEQRLRHFIDQSK